MPHTIHRGSLMQEHPWVVGNPTSPKNISILACFVMFWPGDQLTYWSRHCSLGVQHQGLLEISTSSNLNYLPQVAIKFGGKTWSLFILKHIVCKVVASYGCLLLHWMEVWIEIRFPKSVVDIVNYNNQELQNMGPLPEVTNNFKLTLEGTEGERKGS